MFIDDKHLLTIENSRTWSLSILTNLETKEQTLLGYGNAKYMTKGEYSGYFLVSGLKRYFDEGGAYWYSALYNRDGKIVRILHEENSDKCIPIKKIVDLKKHIEIKQSPDECIYVSYWNLRYIN